MINRKGDKKLNQNLKFSKSTYRIINQQVRLTPVKRLKQKCEHMLPERFKIKKYATPKLKDLSPVITARLKTSQQNSINFETSLIKPQKQRKSFNNKNLRLTSRIRQKYKQKFRYLSQQKKRASSIALPNFNNHKSGTPPSNLLNKNIQFKLKDSQQKKRKSKSYSQSLLFYVSKNNLSNNTRKNKNSSPAINHMLRMTKIKQMYNMIGEERRKASKIVERYNNLSVQSRKLTLGKDQKVLKSQSYSQKKHPCHIHLSNRLKSHPRNMIPFRINNKNNIDVLDRIEKIKNNRLKNLEKQQQNFYESTHNQEMITRWEPQNQLDYRHQGEDQFYSEGKYDQNDRIEQQSQRKYYQKFDYKNFGKKARTPVRKISKSNVIN